MRKAGYSFLAIVMLLAACSTNKVAATNKNGKASTEKRQIACGNKQLAANRPHLDWLVEDKINVATTGMPKAFDLYSIDEVQLKEFFDAAKPAGDDNPGLKTLVPLPQPVGCKVFQLQPSQTMSPELSKQYPAMVSLKGNCVGERMPCDVRMDYDGKVLNAQIKWNDKIYMVSPVASGGKTYYMVYDRADVTTGKQPFEENNK